MIRLRLAPPGLPELMCRVCGDVKPPKQRCWNCFKSGRIYRGRVIINVKLQEIIARRRAPLIEEWNQRRNRWKATKRGAVLNRRRQRSRIATIRTRCVEMLEKTLSQLVNCFEKDRESKYQIYADRLTETQDVVRQAEELLPLVRKTYKRTQSRQSPPAT